MNLRLLRKLIKDKNKTELTNYNGDSYLSLGEIRNRRKAQNKEYYELLNKNKKARIKHTNLLFEEIDTLKKLTKELQGGKK